MPWLEILALALVAWVLVSFIIAWLIGRAISDQDFEYEQAT